MQFYEHCTLYNMSVFLGQLILLFDLEFLHHGSTLLFVHGRENELTFQCFEKLNLHLSFAVNVEGFAEVVSKVVGAHVFDRQPVSDEVVAGQEDTSGVLDDMTVIADDLEFLVILSIVVRPSDGRWGIRANHTFQVGVQVESLHLSDFGFDGDDEWGIFDEEIDVLPFSFVQIVGGDADVSPAIFALYVLDLELALSSGTLVDDLSVWQGLEVASHPANLRLRVSERVAFQRHVISNFGEVNLGRVCVYNLRAHENLKIEFEFFWHDGVDLAEVSSIVVPHDLVDGEC